MSLENKVWAFALITAILLAGGAPSPLLADVITIEDEDAVVPTPTPKPRPTKVPTAVPAVPPATQTGPKAAAPARETAPLAGDREVKMSTTLGFHYFVKSGFLVKDLGGIPSLGKVRNFQGQLSFSTPKKCRVEPSEGANFQVDDRLMVFRVRRNIREERSGYSGYWVENLGILKIIESDEEGILAEVVKTYGPFEDGDLLKPFNEEMDRWNQASTRKALPSEPVRCFVAGGIHDELVQPGFVFLTGGAEQGVVEGMVLEVRAGKNDNGPGKTTPAGKVRVFYAGEDHSLAQILNSPRPIHKGFEATFRP